MKIVRNQFWRVIEDGTDDGRRVLMRQVVDGGEQYAEILESAGWQRASESIRIRPAPRPLRQVETSWVA